MELDTCRFGKVEITPADLLVFPTGLVGLERCREWVLLADAANEALGWLQSTERADVALAVVSPRRFVSNYQIRVSSRELTGLKMETMEDAQVLVIVGKNEHGCTLNLKAPLVFNLKQQLGAQVVAKDDHPLQYELQPPAAPLKKSA
jgi:flagellar assembly factor FliW